MYVKIAAIQTLALAETDKVSINIYFQGCYFRCKGCHNPELWDFNGGRLVDCQELVELLRDLKPFHDALVFLGGEPLAQKEALEFLAEWGKHYGYETWLYTGHEFSELPPSVVRWFDYIKCGRYIDELKTDSFPASSNQYIVCRRDVI